MSKDASCAVRGEGRRVSNTFEALSTASSIDSAKVVASERKRERDNAKQSAAEELLNRKKQKRPLYMRDYRARHKRIKIATRSGGALAETTVGSSDQGSSRITASSCERRECDIDGNVSTEEATKTKSAETSAGVAAQDKKRKQALYSRNYRAKRKKTLASSREGVADRGSSDMAPAEMATKQNKLKRPADTVRASRAT
ncbi:hypothetical protein PHYSODRAFT_329353 [Phytophthora sojae]|uniref:Uncharacterized protein n=1 Tax=Phytophthora sojae (strain P6497) TaxID=1094619 RepID=G4Z267_PHYSP|nr:hypothetical protein PHYSODRAFT_329353 [Phytophthora sojae]EGZ21402.1 hypothetical protein PHYSODRAFT_329353 [Phytophthora sojae]|eukprot:XP_009524119.1 hypothetical protein PHYSODRAFT_329353 [Phytophthora sojae]